MKFVQKMITTIGSLGVSGVALAQDAGGNPPDFSTLTGSVTVEGIVTGLMAVAAVMISVHLAWKGVQFIMRAVKGA